MDANKAHQMIQDYFRSHPIKSYFHCNECDYSTSLWFSHTIAKNELGEHGWIKVMCKECGTVYRIDWEKKNGYQIAIGWEEINTNPRYNAVS